MVGLVKSMTFGKTFTVLLEKTTFQLNLQVIAIYSLSMYLMQYMNADDEKFSPTNKDACS